MPRRLGELFEIRSSKRVHKRDWSDHGVPFYRAREIVKLAEHGFVDNELFITEDLFEEFAEKTGSPQGGDLMVTAVGTLGACYLVKEGDRFYFKDASVLWFRPKTQVDSRFVEYAFRAPQLKVQTTDNQGATVGTLTISRAKSLSLPIPSLLEQQRTVAILDEAFAGIAAAVANTEKSLSSARKLFENYVHVTLLRGGTHWRSSSVGDLCEVLDRLRRPVTKKDRRTGPYPYYGATGIVDYVDDFIFDEKLVLVGEDGAKWGRGDRSAFVVAGKVWVNNHAHVLRPNRDALLDEWLVYVLNAKDLSPYITGLTVPKLNQAKLRQIRIPLPPRAEQRRIVSEFDALRESTDQYVSAAERKILKLDELKQSLLQKAFSGELTAKEADKEMAAA